MRRFVPVVALLLAGVFPATAAAVPPVNDTIAGATAIDVPYTATGTTVQIPPVAPLGGWVDSTVSDEDNSPNVPSCLASAGFHSMWWIVTIKEASVLSVKLTSESVTLYQPVVTIIGPVNSTSGATPTELACGLGQNDSRSSPSAQASSYVAPGQYLIRAASATLSVSGTDGSDLPNVALTASLRDVTAPAIVVQLKSKVLGVGQRYTFDARDSTDGGSGLDVSSATWQFYDNGGVPHLASPGQLVGSYVWKTPGLHKVTLSLGDMAGNKSVYTFFQFVHSFVLPTVGLTVFPPRPGATQLRVVISHSVPVNVRLVVLQAGRVLRVVSSRLVKGSHAKTSLMIALKHRVKAKGYVVVSGTAGDLSSPPNTVPLLTCSGNPVNGTGVCA